MLDMCRNLNRHYNVTLFSYHIFLMHHLNHQQKQQYFGGEATQGLVCNLAFEFLSGPLLQIFKGAGVAC